MKIAEGNACIRIISCQWSGDYIPTLLGEIASFLKGGKKVEWKIFVHIYIGIYVSIFSCAEFEKLTDRGYPGSPSIAACLYNFI